MFSKRRISLSRFKDPYTPVDISKSSEGKYVNGLKAVKEVN